MRDIKKAIRQGREISRKRSNLDLHSNEMDFFYEQFQKDFENNGMCNALWNIISRAYEAGLAIGIRNH